MPTQPSLNEVISQLVNRIESVSQNLFNVLERWIDQVTNFGRGVVSGLFSWSSSLFADQVIHYLKRLKIHLQDLMLSLEQWAHGFEVMPIVELLYEKDAELVRHMANNPSFNRSYGWYIKKEIRPLIKKWLYDMKLV